LDYPEFASESPLSKVTQKAPAQARPVEEMSILKLRSSVETKQGTIPVGTTGTVVHAYSDGQAYIIEFYEPFHAVATVAADAVAA
jgi:hypothetical protein